MSLYYNDLESTLLQPPHPQQSVYKKDLTSIQRMVFGFKSAYDHKNLSPSEFNTYHKNAHEIHILLNSFLKNSFQVLSKKDMIGCLRNWQSLVYDQNDKTKQMMKNYIQVNSQLQQKNTSLVQKVTSTCERCYQDMRKVNIQQVKQCLQNQYMGTLDRMIAQAKMQINGQLFAEQEDQIFFKHLHNTLKKKHDQIQFNNKSIESLINKITKEISQINILKKMSLHQDGQLEPPSYTWMRNIKSALNDLLQTTFKNKVPMFIQNMVKLFQEHLAQRNQLLLRPMHTQTDNYENSQISDLKQKIIKINGAKFKLQNDLKWTELQLQNTKTQLILKIQQQKKQLEAKWTQLIEQKQKNKRLKAAMEVIAKQTDTVRGELRKKLQLQKKRQKGLTKLQNEKNSSQLQFSQTFFLKKTMSDIVKDTYYSEQQNTQNSNTVQKSDNIPNKVSQKIQQQQRQQRFKQGQQQSRHKAKKPVSKYGLKFRKPQKSNSDEIQSINLKKKISQGINQKLAKPICQKSEDFCLTSSKIHFEDEELNEKEFSEGNQTNNEHQGEEDFGIDEIEPENNEINQKHQNNLVQKEAKQHCIPKKSQSIIIEEESQNVSNNTTPYRNKQNFTKALESIQKSLKKQSQSQNQGISEIFSQAKSNFISQVKLNSNPNVKTDHHSEYRESVSSMIGERKYNQEVIRVNQMMEKRIKRSGIILPSRLSKQSNITAKTANKFCSQLSNYENKIEQKPQEETIVEMGKNLLRKSHFRSQTMINNIKSYKDKNFNGYVEHERQTQKSQTPIDFAISQFKDSQSNNSTINHHQFSWIQMFDTSNFNQDLEALMKQIKNQISSNQDKSDSIKNSIHQTLFLKGLMIQFLQKNAIHLIKTTESINLLGKHLKQFQRKNQNSVSLQKEKIIKPNQTNCFVKKSQLKSSDQNENNKPNIMYKTCFTTPKNNQDHGTIGNRNSTHNIMKRNVWKSLPEQADAQNKQSHQKAKLKNKSQRPLLRDIKNYGHKKHESCELEHNLAKRAHTKVNIFTKEDFDIFIDEATAYSYECAHIKRLPKQISIEHIPDYKGLIDNIFMNMEQIREYSQSFYDQIVSFIRYPYHTLKNLSWGACMVRGIKYENFLKFMERIICLHIKCPISPGLGYCAHLNIFRRKIQFVKKQTEALTK